MTAAEGLGDGVAVLFAELQVPDAAIEAGLATLSIEELSRAVRWHQAADRRRFIVSHLALRSALSERTRIDAGKIELRYTSNGKPVLSGAQGVEFSLSRAGELAAIAVAPVAIGIDVVAISSGVRLVEAATEFCTSEELHSVSNLSPRLKVEALVRVWTRKEALLKATGEGLTRAPSTIPVWGDEPWTSPAPPVTLDGDTWIIRDIGAPAGYRAALALRAA